jgi:hypothetical protein
MPKAKKNEKKAKSSSHKKNVLKRHKKAMNFWIGQGHLYEPSSERKN